MNGVDEGFYGAALVAIGAVVGFVLAKLGIATSENADKVSMWISGVVAGVMALGADVSNTGLLLEVFGRAAIFGLVYIFMGIVFTFSLMIGIEKVENNNRKDS